jgi:hypothetical protein
MLSLNDFGRPWPNPRRDVIAQLLDQFGADTCIAAAEETRRIIQNDDRAPNVTALFAKKCADIAAERESVRDEIRRALA